MIKRIYVPTKEYALQPVNTIKSFLGVDIEVIRANQSDTIRYDGLVEIEVEYKSLEINPIQIYYINRSELKPISPDSQEYGTKINDINILVNISPRMRQLYKTIVPLRVMRKDYAEDRKYFQYYGTVVMKPLGYLCTAFLSKGNWSVPDVQKLYPDKYFPKTVVSEEKMISAYEFEAKKFKLFGELSDVKIVDTFDACENELVGYVIPWERIQNETISHGIILIQPERIWNMVMYVPTAMFSLNKNMIDSIDKFIQFSKTNWLNCSYIAGL